MKNYIIIKSENSIYELEEKVNSSILNGYVPLGGMSVVLEQKGYSSVYTHTFFQTMILSK
jgi:hypothetical protein